MMFFEFSEKVTSLHVFKLDACINSEVTRNEKAGKLKY